MARWKTNFESQQALQKVQGIQRIVESAKSDDLPPPTLEEISRLLKVLKIIEAKLSSLDPELFRHNAWGSFTPWLDSAQNNIVQFNQNRNVGHLTNANNTLDEILTILRPAGSEYSSDDIKALADASSQFTQTIVQELELVRKRFQELKAQFETLSSAIVEAKTRLGDNDKVIQEQKTRLDQSIAEFQKQFSQAQEQRTKGFADAVKKNSDEVADQIKALTAQFNEVIVKRKQDYTNFIEEVQTKNKAHLEFLEKREAEVKRIFNVIGNVAVAGDYKNTADHERTSANWLRGIALVLMLLMATVAAMTFWHSLTHAQVDWKLFAFRLGTTLILAVPAFYAAQESAKHREREKLNRKLHLELSAIDAYLELLPAEKRQELKAKLTERFFGQPEVKDKDEPVTKHELFELLSKVVQNFTKGK